MSARKGINLVEKTGKKLCVKIRYWGVNEDFVTPANRLNLRIKGVLSKLFDIILLKDSKATSKFDVIAYKSKQAAL